MTSRAGLLVAILIVAPGITYSQTFYRNVGPDCVERERMVLQSIPEYYEQGNFAKIDSTLNNLDISCFFPLEFSWRMKTLLKLRDHSLGSKDFNLKDFYHLSNYLEEQRTIALLNATDEFPARHFKFYYGDNSTVIFSYNDFTRDLASQILADYQSTPDCSTEKIILNAYSGNTRSVSEQLRDDNCKAPPALVYRNALKEANHRALLDAYIYSGVWVPYGNNKILGNHPFIGFGMGGGRKFIFDFTMEFRFSQAANYYVVQNKGQSIVTNHFFGGYIGVDVNYNYLTANRLKFYIVSGLGLDGFDVIDDNSNQNHEGKSINTFNVNAGLGWRLFTPDGTYAGLEVRNNFVNYKNPGGTPLDGNTISIRLIYGMMRNQYKSAELRRLHNIVKQ